MRRNKRLWAVMHAPGRTHHEAIAYSESVHEN